MTGEKGGHGGGLQRTATHEEAIDVGRGPHLRRRADPPPLPSAGRSLLARSVRCACYGGRRQREAVGQGRVETVHGCCRLPCRLKYCHRPRRRQGEERVFARDCLLPYSRVSSVVSPLLLLPSASRLLPRRTSLFYRLARACLPPACLTPEVRLFDQVASSTGKGPRA